MSECKHILDCEQCNAFLKGWAAADVRRIRFQRTVAESQSIEEARRAALEEANRGLSSYEYFYDESLKRLQLRTMSPGKPS